MNTKNNLVILTSSERRIAIPVTDIRMIFETEEMVKIGDEDETIPKVGITAFDGEESMNWEVDQDFDTVIGLYETALIS